MALCRSMVIAAALALNACNNSGETGASTEAVDSSAPASAQGRLANALGDTDALSSTAALVRAAGLEHTFDGAGNYTLFAPTNAAIAALPESERTFLNSPEGRPQLIALLRQHAVSGYVGKADLDRGLSREGGTVTLASLGDAPLTLRKQGESIVLGHGTEASRLTGQPIPTRNGVIYPIDRVLPPPSPR